MEGKFVKIGYNRKNITPDIARVLDTLIANLPSDTDRIPELTENASQADIIKTLNKVIAKLNANTNLKKL